MEFGNENSFIKQKKGSQDDVMMDSERFRKHISTVSDGVDDGIEDDNDDVKSDDGTLSQNSSKQLNDALKDEQDDFIYANLDNNDFK